MNNIRKIIKSILLEEFSKEEEDWFASGENKKSEETIDNNTSEVKQKIEKLKDEEITVGELIKEIERSNKKTWIKAITLGFLETAAWIIGGIISVPITNAAILFNVIRAKHSELAPKYKEMEDFPMLQKLMIHPDYIKVLDSPVLKLIMNQYENYLRVNVNPETKISQVISLNNFIEKLIANNFKIKISLQEALRKKLLTENYKPQYRYLYHGTTELAGEQIQSQGFDASLVGKKSGDEKNIGISFTIDQEIAADHAIWALKGNFETDAAIVVVQAGNMRIMNGTEFQNLWDNSSYDAAINHAKNQGFDGVEYFDLETGNGIEEMEVLLFYPDKINIYSVNYLDPKDFIDYEDESYQ